ncbi:hypothetical protein PFICI_04699 [Pestalotiopsis fici W106-1]|uniref:Clr5 domain-containing protein n=1 Tax=Pestalotiopsis fici (strain W106-1 / CGMCC3.15140) TaxID=1229662 RepID=W3X9N6_PESFW|nr:uncharacterized protein PFICI_04699 [Pestalotiopsis fici W106-1]ETS82823.1 hypothetical protein PFICI_04699 [Pestalotiopsis fici W106-1]
MIERHLQPAAYPDWARYKKQIISLYAVRTLPEVMQIMREEHHFVASPMMYKKHLRNWGVQKNLRSHQVAEALGKPCDHTLDELSNLYTGFVDKSRVQGYLRRLPEERRTRIITAIHEGLSATQTARSLHSTRPKPPSTERYLSNVHEYVRGMFGSQAWSKHWLSNPSLYGKNFESFDLSMTAKKAADHGHTDQAFRIIDFTFKQLQSCMQHGSADILVYFHSSALVYHSIWPELTLQWSKHTKQLSRIYYNSQDHAGFLTGWIEPMLQTNLEDWLHFSIQVINLYCEVLSEHVSVDNTLNSHIVLARAMILSRLRNAKVAAVSTDDLISVGRLTFENFGRQNVASVVTKSALAGIRFDEGRFEEVHQLLTQILQSDDIDKYLEVKAFCYKLLALVANRMGHSEEEMLMTRQSVMFCTANFTLDNELTLDAFYDMENLLRSRGQQTEADAYRQLTGDILDGVVKHLDRVALGENRVPETVDAESLPSAPSRLLASTILETWRTRW